MQDNYFKENGKWVIPQSVEDNLTLCVLACLVDDNLDCRAYLTGELDELYYFVEQIQKKLIGDTKYYPYFKEYIKSKQEFHKTGLEYIQSDIHKKVVSDLQKGTQKLEKENENLRNDLKALKIQYQSIIQKIDEQDQTISSLRLKDSSKFDKALTLRYVLDYIKSRRQYNLSDQIIGMLKDMARLATDEEYDEIKSVEQQMLDASMPKVENHNNISNSQVFSGLVNNSSFPIGVNPEEIINKALEQYTKCQNNGKQE